MRWFILVAMTVAFAPNGRAVEMIKLNPTPDYRLLVKQ